MINTNSILMRLCTENVYHDNIFHLLGLQTTATPRQIRRRREDLEVANSLGGTAWEESFGYLMGNRPLPTWHEIDEAFQCLEEPEYRIVSEFFWMWPYDDNQALEKLLNGHKTTAIQIWEQDALGYGKRRLIAQHNLAVLYQFYALDAELQALEYEDDLPEDFRDAMLSYWEKAINYWEEITCDDAFWQLYENRIVELDDPRLDKRFCSQFREMFPIAFDNINLQLATQYAKAFKSYDAKRHIEYMKRTMAEVDNIQENLNIIFEPLCQRVKVLINAYEAKVKQNPASGLECAYALLKETAEIRRVVMAVLDKDDRIWISLYTSIVSACNHYQVSYGNKTEDWAGCLKLLTTLKDIACTLESKQWILKNIETVKKNLAYVEEQNTCWICKSKNAKHHLEISMYGDVERPMFSNRITWRHTVIKVPVCSDCKERYPTKESIGTRVTIATCILGAICGGIVGGGGGIIAGIIIGAVASVIPRFIFGSIFGIEEKCRDFPPIHELFSKGWTWGKSPN